MRGPTPSSWALAMALGTAVFFAVSSASGAGPSAGALRQREAELAKKSRSALLGLYSLDSRLDQAEANLATLQSRADELRRERASARNQLAIAQRVFALSQRQLGQRLRVLYEHDDVDPLEIVLGAGSLDEAITGIDGLNTLASQNQSVIRQTRTARASLSLLARSLAAREAELSRVLGAAERTAASLGHAKAERQAFIVELASQRRLAADALGALDARARAAEERAATLAIQNGNPPGALAPIDPPPAPFDVPTAPAGGQTLTVTATGYALGGQTSTGLPVGWGVVAVDPGVIPLGTRMTIPGYGEGVAADTGGAVRGPTIDLWFPSVVQAFAWGRRTVTIVIQ